MKKINGQKLIFVVLILCELAVNLCFSKILTNSYLVEFVRDIEPHEANDIALRNGFINTGPVSFNFTLIFSKIAN